MTSCSMEFFKKVKALCATEFMTYATCLERGSANMEFTHCRNTQVRNQFSVLVNPVTHLFPGCL